MARGLLLVYQRTTWWKQKVEEAAQALDTPAQTARGRRPKKEEERVWDKELGEKTGELRAGQLFGEAGCVYLENRDCTVRTVSNVDMWQIPRADWLDIMLTDAFRFMQVWGGPTRPGYLPAIPPVTTRGRQCRHLCPLVWNDVAEIVWAAFWSSARLLVVSRNSHECWHERPRWGGQTSVSQRAYDHETEPSSAC